jgi:hypothetical protein
VRQFEISGFGFAVKQLYNNLSNRERIEQATRALQENKIKDGWFIRKSFTVKHD